MVLPAALAGIVMNTFFDDAIRSSKVLSNVRHLAPLLVNIFFDSPLELVVDEEIASKVLTSFNTDLIRMSKEKIDSPTMDTKAARTRKDIIVFCVLGFILYDIFVCRD